MGSQGVPLDDIPSMDIMTELLRRMKCASKPDKRLIFIGPPASGKGTQSSIIKDEYCLCHLSTGDMLRAKKDEDLAVGKLEEMLRRQGTKIDMVLNFAADDAILEERITGRRIHPPSGRIYHTKFAPPIIVGMDDVTGEPLIQRKDDTPEVLKPRLDTFHQQTKPVIDYYSKKGVVTHIPADKTSKEVTEMIHRLVSA